MKFVLFVTLIWSILDSGWSITDEEYIQFKVGLTQIQDLTKEVQDLKNENQVLTGDVQVLRNEKRAEQLQIQDLMRDVTGLKAENKQMKIENNQLHLRVDHLEENCGLDQDLAQNTTIEERVTILEAQMTEVQEDVAGLQNAVDFLFDEQVLQDERILTLEQETEGLEERVEVLEANGGGGGNVTALEERVETLEGTAAEHEADIADLESTTSNLDGRVETLEGETSELETRLTAAETLIEGLQQADIELDSRISDLEEGGGGGATNNTIAFSAKMADDDDADIPEGSTIIFSDVQLNEGNGYDPATGVFTVPSGGQGYYYFDTHLIVLGFEYAFIDLTVNDVTVCSVVEDTQDAGDYDSSGCSFSLFLEEGDEVKNVYRAGADSTPVYEISDGFYNGFTGFRI